MSTSHSVNAPKAHETTPSGDARSQAKQANRLAIMDAARTLFVDKGYGAVSVRDIIRGTGLATGTFYNHFQDKETVFRAVIDAHMGDLTRELVRIRRGADTLEAFVHRTYSFVFETVVREPVFYALIFRNQAVIRAFYEDVVLGMSISSLESDIRDAQQRGLIPDDLDVGYLAAAFFGVGHELGRALSQRPRARQDPAQAASVATQIFLRGIAR